VNWDKPEERQEWFHNMSSVLQAGPTYLTNQLDYDREVMYKVSEQAYASPSSFPRTDAKC
jgi:choline-sulfatase